MRLVLFAAVNLLFLQAAIFGQTSAPVGGNSDCPQQLVVTISPTLARPGEVVTATAAFVFDKNRVDYNWMVQGGKLLKGQGTAQIEVKVTDLNEGLTATVTLGGISPNCANFASATLQIHRPPLAVLVDEYEIVPFRIRKERLDNFVVHLQNNSGEQALIAAESKAPNSRKTMAFLGRTYGYLVNTRGVDPKAILFAIKKGDADQIRLYSVSPGASAPLTSKEYLFVKGENLLQILAPPPKSKPTKRNRRIQKFRLRSGAFASNHNH